MQGILAKRFNILIIPAGFFIIIFQIVISIYPSLAGYQNEHNFKIRILSKYSLDSVELKIIKGYIKMIPNSEFQIPNSHLNFTIHAHGEKINIYNGLKYVTVKKLQLLSADKMLLKNTTFCVSANKVTGLNRTYKGELEIFSRHNKLILINTLNLEEYLKSVVSSEMPFNNIEALKAQAVVSRTYALTKSDKHNKDGYNFCDTTCCQVYYGADAENKQGRTAINLTQGEILEYKGRLIEIFYHSTCGGFLADNHDVFKGKKLPYYLEKQDRIKGESEDNCKASPHYSQWEVTYSSEQILKALKKYYKITKIIDIKIIDSSPKDIAKEVEIKTPAGGLRLDGYTFWQTCASNLGWGGIKSINFKIYKKNNFYTFKGQGLGHLVGLCQWGAYGMALKGKTYKQILLHYFPKTQMFRK